jgi:hypothetical protein
VDWLAVLAAAAAVVSVGGSSVLGRIPGSKGEYLCLTDTQLQNTASVARQQASFKRSTVC